MHRVNTVRNILFDLDGTLVDSSRTILDSVEHALESLGVDPQTGPGIESLIGKRPFADPTPGESATVAEVEPTTPSDGE